MDSVWGWVLFNLFVLAMLAADLGLFHRKAHEVSLREAAAWSAVWIALALLFNAAVYRWMGATKALEFLTGYIIEKSLSVDNLFVFVMVFGYFAVPARYQHRVLFFGVLGALIMRGILIALGAVLIQRFHWVIYIFGAFLIITGIKFLVKKEEELHPERNPLVRLARRLLPVTEGYEEEHFLVQRNGTWMATPLLIVLIVVETTDLVFAVDSIPAIFAITADPFIVYTSNVFAILGLRSLYFLLAGVMGMFRYLKVGLAAVLCFVGAKMMLVDIYKLPILISLGIVAALLALSIAASLLVARSPQAVAEKSGKPAKTD